MKRFLSKELLILYLIILIGAFLRLQGVFTNSFAFTYDVGRDMLALWNIVYAHKIPLIGATTGLPGVFYGPWWYYMLSIPFLMSSGNPQGIALTMSFIGILAIIAAFIVGKKAGGIFLGFCFSALIAASPVLISLSSQIWNPNIAPLFVILIIFVLGKIYSFKKENQKYYFLLGLLLALNIDFEIIFGLFLSLGVIISLIWIKYKKISLKSIAFLLLGSFVIFAPRAIFELRHQFLMTKSFITFITGGNFSHSISSVLEALINRLNIFFNLFNSTLAVENKILGLTFLIFILITLFIFYRGAEKSIKNLLKTSFVVIATFLIGTVFFSHDIWPHYLVGIPVFYIFIFSCCFYFIYKRFSCFLIPLIVLIIFLVNLNPIFIIQNLKKPLWEGDASVYRNQLGVIDYVYKEANGKEFKYVVYTPPVYDFTYQYLFKWYGPKKYKYSPTQKVNIAYFIIEPDLGYPDRPKWWLEAREKDGKIIKEQKIEGGIIIQTRVVK